MGDKLERGSSWSPGGAVETVTFGDVGTCSCGSTEFHVNAVVKTFASVRLNNRSGELNIDDTDLKPNLEESEVVLESAQDLILVNHMREIPPRIKDKIYLKDAKTVEIDPSRYVIVRCSSCGTPFDYGDKRVVLGFDE